MKRLLAVLVLSLTTVVAAHAQFGIVGGFTSSATFVDTQNPMENLKNVSLFHAGVAYKVKMGPMFVLEPALMYQMKGANLHESVASVKSGATTLTDMSKSFDSKTGYVELSLGAQLGIDLLAFRPYLLFEPFVGVKVYDAENYASSWKVGTAEFTGGSEDINKALSGAKNLIEGGFGVGAGVELVNHVQISVQWFMNLGKLYNEDKLNQDVLADVKANYKDIHNYQGVKLTLGIFF